MTSSEAVKLADEWVKVRKECRKHLIALARKNHPRVIDTETRKLHLFPSDLSEERLLALVYTVQEPKADMPASN